MKLSFFYALCTLFLPALIVAACGAPSATAQPDRVGTQVAEAQAVSATLTALARASAPASPAALASGTASSQGGSAASSSAPTPAAAPPPTTLPGPAPTQPAQATAPTCTVQASGLRMRGGPGTAYEPPLAALPAGTGLVPLAFIGQGYPEGQWVQVRVVGTGQAGWVSAAPQLVTCTIDLAGLPAGAAPATPAATVVPVPPTAMPTRTPAPLAFVNVPVAGENGDVTGDVVASTTAVVGQKPLAFHDRVVIQVHARDQQVKDKSDGAGIRSVEFSITDQNGDEVHHQIENNAAYCAFGNSGPQCDPWVFAAHGGKWPKGQPAQPGKYRVFITIEPTDDSHRGANWNFEFVLK